MDKKSLAIFVLVFFLSLSFVSAGWFSDLFGRDKITGEIIGQTSCTFDNPKTTDGRGILHSSYYYGTNYSLYAETYCLSWTTLLRSTMLAHRRSVPRRTPLPESLSGKTSDLSVIPTFSNSAIVLSFASCFDLFLTTC